MTAKIKFGQFSFAIILLLVVSLSAPMAALADDGTPPPDPTSETEPPAETEVPVETTEQAASGEETPAVESTEAAPTEEATEEIPTDEPVEDPAPDELTLPEVLEQTPEGTEVVVLDENGDALPLATEEAAEILVTSDPMWCPDGVTPGDPGCSPAQDSMNDLLVWLAANDPGMAGTIWIEDSYDSGSNPDDSGWDFTLDGSLFTNMSNYALTIQGGWSGGNDTVVDPGDQSEFNGSLWIYNWIGDITLNDLIFAGTSDIGVYVDTEGDVTAENIHAYENEVEGMYVEAGGNVTVNNSQFEENGLGGYQDDDSFDIGDDVSVEWYEFSGASGLYVDAGGNITLNQVLAALNGLHGAELYTGGDSSVTVTDSEFFENGYVGYYYDEFYVDDDESDYYENFSQDFYGGSGLLVETGNGDITLSGVEAGFNANHGAALYSDAGDISVSDSAFYVNGEVGSGYSELGIGFSESGFYHNLWMDYAAGSGLVVGTDGSVTLNQVFAVENANNGTLIYTDGPVSISDSVFSGNGWSSGFFDEECWDECDCEEDDCFSGYGYYWLTSNLDGDLYYDDLYALCDGDGPYAAEFDNLMFDLCDDYWYILVGGPNFSLGAGNGVYPVDEEAEYYEQGYGIDVEGGTGLIVETEGGISLESVQANSNSGAGALLDNESPQSVTVTDSEFSGNGYLGELYVSESASEVYFSEGEPEYSYSVVLGASYSDGLNIYNEGDISLVDVEASGNAGDGADLYSDSGTLLVTEGEFNGNGTVPIYVGGDGLFGEFLCYGSYLDFCDELEIPASSLEFYLSLGSEHLELQVETSTGTGLEVDWADAGIMIDDVNASGNGGYGADVGTSGNAAITNSQFLGNGYGLFVDIELSLTDLCGCGDDYLYVYVSEGSGLYTYAEGDITIDNLQADGNALYGAELYSDAIDSVTVSNSGFNGNGYGLFGGFFLYQDEDESIEEFWGGSGLYIESSGNIHLENVTASGNNADGAELFSNGDAEICNSSFEGNGGYGVDAEYVDGSLTLSDVTFAGNGSGDYIYPGSAVVTSGFDCLPVEPDEDGDPDGPAGGPGDAAIIPVTGGEQVTCEGLSSPSVTIVLPNGDHVVLPCPINDFAVLNSLLEDGLLEDLGDGLTFLSALDVSVIRSEDPVETIDGVMTVAFIIPEGVEAGDLSILWWNGSEWVDLGEVSGDGLTVFEAGHATGDGYFEALVNFTGSFILVKK